MIDSTDSGDKVDQCTAWSAELVVEADAGGEAQNALQDALVDARKGAGTVAFESEQVVAGPKDRLDALAYPSKMQLRPRLVFAAGTEDRGIELADGTCEIAAGRPRVTEQRLASGAP
jgi:hypothetical protein